MDRRHELADGASLADDWRQLRPCGRNVLHVVLAERARLGSLDDQYPLEDFAVDDRHPQERPVRILAGVMEVLEARMRRRVVDDDGAYLFGHEAHEPFGEPHAHAPDAFGTQPDRRRQHEIGAIRLEQVDGAHVDGELAVNQVDDVRQRFGRIAAARDKVAQIIARPGQHRRLAGAREFVAVHGDLRNVGIWRERRR